MNQDRAQLHGSPMSASDRHTAMHHTVGSTVESLLSEGNAHADLAQALEGAARALRAHGQSQASSASIAPPSLLADVAKWMHAAYDRPPQSPEVRDILARMDAAVAGVVAMVPQPLKEALEALQMMRGMSDGFGNELIEKAIEGLDAHIADAGRSLAGQLKALRQAIGDHDATPELDASNWACKVCGNWTPHWHPERHAHADDCAAQRDCEQRRATWKTRALAAVHAIEQNADLAQEDPGSDSACLKRVVEVSGFAERAHPNEDIIDYVTRLAHTSPVAAQTVSAAESDAELLCDGAEPIAVEAFMHAINGGHRHELYKLPLRTKLRAALASGPGMREFIEEAGRKGWMSDTGREPRINLVMFAWRAALNAAFAGRESPQSTAAEIWRLRFNTGIEGAEEPKWMYVDGAAGKHFVSEVEGRPGWEIQTLAPTP